METQLLHEQGPVLSRIVAGAWRWKMPHDQVEQLIHQSLDCGITTFDHADLYGEYSNEEIFGRVLKDKPSLRDSMQIVTKCGIRMMSGKRPEHWVKHYDTSKQHILNSVENSLRNLNTDRIDLLLIHRPDPLMDPAEIAETFSLLKQNGKVLHFGVSNFTATQFEMLQEYMNFPLVTNQLELSLFNNELFFDGTIDTMIKHGVSPMAWSPLGGGKPFNDRPDLIKQLDEKASKFNASVSQLLMAWLLRHPSKITVVAGTTRPERIKEAAEAVNIGLDRQDWFDMLRLARGFDVP